MIKTGTILYPKQGEKLHNMWDFTPDFSVIVKKDQFHEKDDIYTHIHTGYLVKDGRNQHGPGVGYTIIASQFNLNLPTYEIY